MYNDQFMIFELMNIKFDCMYVQIMNILKIVECIFWGFVTCIMMFDDFYIEFDLYMFFE